MCALVALTPSDIGPPNVIFPASLKLTKTVPNGKLYRVEGGDINLQVAHVYGDSGEMGYAHGQLLADQALDFLINKIPEFYDEQIDQIPLGDLPEWLQKIIKAPVKGAAPEVFGEALGYVFNREKQYISESPSTILTEMDQMAHGICNGTTATSCDPVALSTQIEHLNMLPELIRMTCSMFGAWGEATPDGNLVQLRTLDFGSGPFANYTVMTVYHPAVGNPFASVGFPGFSGAITGFSQKVALSEKVWETYEGTGVQPGHYNGVPATLMIRDMLQFSDTKEEAIAYAQKTRRTWAVFLGVGDSASQSFRALGSREADLTVVSPDNNKDITNQTSLADVVYIDKHPQPSHDNHTLPDLMAKYHGQITGEIAVQQIARLEQSGDLHTAAYDFGSKKVWVSVGKVDSKGNYGPDGHAWQACNRPFAEFDMDALFSDPKPPAV